MTLLYSKRKPLYQEVYDWILEDAYKAGGKKGNPLPTIKEMARKYQVSETPIRKALAELQNDGKVVSVRGSGTYLKETVLTAPDVNKHFQELDIESYVPFINVKKERAVRLGLIDSLPTHRKMWLEIIRRFNLENPQIHIEPVFNLNSNDLLNTPEENLPDIYQINLIELAKAIEKNLLFPLPDNILPEKLPPLTIQPALQDNRIYGLPLTISIPFQLANKNILSTAGIDLDPNAYDWNKFIQTLEDLAKARNAGKIPDNIISTGTGLPCFFYLAGYCDDFFVPQNKEFLWDTPKVMEFFQLIEKCSRIKGGLTPDIREIKDRGFLNLFDEEKIAIISMSAIFREAGPLEIPDFIQPLPLPLSKHGKTLWTTNYHGVNFYSSMVEESIKFLEFLFSPEIHQLVIECGQYHVLGNNINQVPEPELFNAWEESLSKGIPCTFYGQANYDFVKKFFNYLTKLVHEGIINSEEAVKILNDKYQTFICGREINESVS